MPTNDNDTLIQFDQVQKAFDDKVVFADLTLGIRRGESLAIVGASGTGKSVMLRLLIGLLRVDSGSIRFDGEEITEMNEDQLSAVRRRVSMMFQGCALFDSMTVADNVAYPLREIGELSEDEITALVDEKLQLVDLPDSRDLLPSALSGGMKKRVALARAIISGPEVIMLDEPTAGLDPINTRMVGDLIRDLQQKLHMTAITVTHDLPSAYQLADRIAMLHEGRILAALPTEEFQHAEIPEIHAFVSAMDEPEPEPVPEPARLASEAR